MRCRLLSVTTFPIVLGATACSVTPFGDERVVAHDTSVVSPAIAVQADTGLAARLERARDTYYRSEYVQARKDFDGVRIDAISSGDHQAEADALTWEGLTAMRQGQYDVARELGERALRLKQEHHLQDDLSRSYNALGLLDQEEGRYDQAVERFADAAAAAKAVDNGFDVAKALGNQGLAYSQMGQLERARAGFEQSLAAAVEKRDARTEANQLVNLAMLEIRTGQPQLAFIKLDSARALYRIDESPLGEENALAQIGTAMDALGDPHRAIAYLDSALVIDSLHDLRMQAAENLQLKAEVFGQLGDNVRALALLDQALAIATELSQQNKIADIARFKAHQYLELDDLTRAERLALDALRLHGRTGAQLDALSDMILLVELSQRDGRSAHARSWMNAAEALGARLDVGVARGEVALARARLSISLGAPAEVLTTIELRQRDIERLGAATQWEAHALRARALAQLGQLDAAVKEGRLAVATIEKTRQRISHGPLRTSYMVRRIGAYADLVKNLLQIGRMDEALEVADAARGRALLEQLSSSSTQLPGASAQRLTESERLLRRIDWLVQQLQIADVTPRRDRGTHRTASASIQRELAQAQRDYESLLQRAATDPSSDATMLAAPDGVQTAQSLRKMLEHREALIEYLVGSGELVTFVMTADTLVSFRTTLNARDLTSRVLLAEKLLRDPASSDNERAMVLRPLHQLLLQPAVASGMLRHIRTLIVVPHGALVHLPFVALVDQRGRFAGEEYDVLTSPSASILAAVRSRAVPGNAGRHAVFAPLPELLPGTREEAEAVTARLPSALQFIGARATERELRKQLAGGGNVHIATHGMLSSASPMFSHIEMTVDSTAGSAGDGRLEVHELLGIPVGSDLVFLSGCETGAALAWTNSFRRGEDFSTLSQAFLFAGARNVVATLWRIDDAGAAAFATAFYEALKSSSPVAALGAAQRQMMRHPTWSAPRYWAGYTLSGAGHSATFAKRRQLSVTPSNTGFPSSLR